MSSTRLQTSNLRKENGSKHRLADWTNKPQADWHMDPWDRTIRKDLPRKTQLCSMCFVICCRPSSDSTPVIASACAFCLSFYYQHNSRSTLIFIPTNMHCQCSFSCVIMLVSATRAQDQLSCRRQFTLRRGCWKQAGDTGHEPLEKAGSSPEADICDIPKLVDKSKSQMLKHCSWSCLPDACRGSYLDTKHKAQ